MSRRPRQRKARSSSPSRALPRRAGIVWASLVAAMTVVGGALLMADQRSAPRNNGLSLPPLLAAGSASGLESILRTRNPIDRPRWKGIVIHHSGQPFGSPASIEADHLALKFAGLGHHFVIGNGSGMDDGELHVAYRWLDQLPGAHAGGDRGDWHNQHSISICLVGNGDRRPFTKAQITRLSQLVATLCRELKLDPQSVKLHNDLAPTSDPGRFFPEALFRQRLAEGN